MTDFVFVLEKRKFRQIKLADIIYITSEKHGCRLITDDDSFFYTHSMKHLLKELPAGRFIRIHDSFIVNIEKIKAFDKTCLHVANKAGVVNELPVTYTYMKTLRESVSFVQNKPGALIKVRKRAQYKLEDEEFEIEMSEK